MTIGTKISQMTSVATLTGGDLMPIARGTTNNKFDLGTKIVAMDAATALKADAAATTASLALKTNVADLAASGGSALSGFLQSGTGATARTSQAKMRDLASAKDWCVADNSTNDTPQFQKAIDATAQYSVGYAKALFMPTGLYRMGASLVPSNAARIYGEGPRASIFSNEGAALATALFSVTGAGLVAQQYANLGARGYRSFMTCSAPVDGLVLDNIHCLNMTEAALEFTSLFQTTIISGLSVENSKYGISCTNTTANLISIYDPEFKNMTDSSIKLAGSQDFHVYNARFEGTTAAGKSAIQLTGAQHLHFHGGYMEGAQQTALTWTGSPSGMVVFEGVHFTYYSPGQQHLWTNNGGQLVFINCEAEIATVVPTGSILIGVNRNISVADNPFVASASTLTLPFGSRMVNVTGTTTIDAIQGNNAFYGTGLVTLVFAAALTLRDVSTGGNCKLAGGVNFAATANDTITLGQNSGGWVEVCRSVN